MLTILNPNLSNLYLIFQGLHAHCTCALSWDKGNTDMVHSFFCYAYVTLFPGRLLFHCPVCRMKCLASMFLTHVVFFPVTLINYKSNDVKWFFAIAFTLLATWENRHVKAYHLSQDLFKSVLKDPMGLVNSLLLMNTTLTEMYSSHTTLTEIHYTDMYSSHTTLAELSCLLLAKHIYKQPIKSISFVHYCHMDNGCYRFWLCETSVLLHD